MIAYNHKGAKTLNKTLKSRAHFRNPLRTVLRNQFALSCRVRNFDCNSLRIIAYFAPFSGPENWNYQSF